jgi:hypothetical protein
MLNGIARGHQDALPKLHGRKRGDTALLRSVRNTVAHALPGSGRGRYLKALEVAQARGGPLEDTADHKEAQALLDALGGRAWT